ncbi:MFS transporter [Nocardia sp. NPDC127579]|uniref:MFS transporter n=1 Tax=Nocardia sp. NPDC127579 TaxID=3345402 RepID=UPI003643E988
MGAAAPVMTLAAVDLGASTAVAGLAVALVGLGQVLGGIPSGQLVARLGERASTIWGTAVGLTGVLLCLLAPNVVVLCAGLLITGLSNAVWGLGRMTYLAEAVTLDRRARAMSLFGGAMRLGFFLGPLLGAGAILAVGIRGGFVVQFVAFLVAGWMLARVPLPAGALSEPIATAPISLLGVVHRHHLVLCTLGAGSLLMGAARASREVILPLWAHHIEIDAATASALFGLAAALELVFAYPAGHLMDRFGRVPVAVPSLTILSLSYLAVPLTYSTLTLGAVAVALGVGNGIGNGLIMVLGADIAPPGIRAEFLAAWRLTHDCGAFGGPLLLGVLAGAAPLAVAALTIGGVAALGAVVMGRYIPRHIPWPAQPLPQKVNS